MFSFNNSTIAALPPTTYAGSSTGVSHRGSWGQCPAAYAQLPIPADRTLTGRDRRRAERSAERHAQRSARSNSGGDCLGNAIVNAFKPIEATLRYLAQAGQQIAQTFYEALPSVHVGPPGADDAEVNLYAEAMRELRDAGIKKVFLAEYHGRRQNLQMVTGALEGVTRARDSSRPVSFYRELKPSHDPAANPSVDETVDAHMRSPAFRAYAVQHLLSYIGNNDYDEKSTAGKAFKAAMSNQKISIKLISFNNPRRFDMKRFLDDKDFAIASVGATHALGTRLRDNLMGFQWAGVVDRIPVPGMLVPPLTPAQQADRFDGFIRAVEKGPAAVVLQNECWGSDKVTNREQLHQFFNGVGLPVLEVPMLEGFNATIIATPEALPAFKKIAKENEGRVYLLCKGIDGCEEKPVDQEL